MPESSPNPNDEMNRLVRLARDGDVAAFGDLVGRTQQTVIAAAHAVLGNRHDAEDAAQDAYLRAYRKLGELDEPRAFLAWVMTAARRCAIDQSRRKKGLPIDPESIENSLAAHTVFSGEQDLRHEMLNRSLLRLTSSERELVELYYVGKTPTARIAERLGLADTTVRKRLERIRIKLKKEILMSEQTESQLPSDLSERVAALLSRPILTGIPDNPVGVLWDEVRANLPGYTELAPPERVTLTEAAAAVGRETISRPPLAFPVDDETMLRPALDIPLLIAAKGRPVPLRVVAAGKVFRQEEERPERMSTFHQCEILRVEPDIDEWAMMPWLMARLDEWMPGVELRIQKESFPLLCDRAWVIYAKSDISDQWLSVAAWAKYRGAIVEAMGHDPGAYDAVTVELGLERIACQRYGLYDIRRVAAERVDKP